MRFPPVIHVPPTSSLLLALVSLCVCALLAFVYPANVGGFGDRGIASVGKEQRPRLQQEAAKPSSQHKSQKRERADLRE